MTIIVLHKRKRRVPYEWTEEQIRLLRELDAERMPPEKIAVRVHKPTKSVVAKIVGLKRSDAGPKPKPAATFTGEMNIVTQAELILQGRIEWRRDTRLLDGSPCSLDRMMFAANSVLFAEGLAQLGNKQEWLI